ncbi:sporulation integral membrane protein YlbJ [Alkalihalobacillus sp. BA299]|uniref:sporulation integral membrane protein YlbJ n=1 Tax=Alkalihalobacillus sp. BA299 TaxID=2815938 RepID=UPI001ADB954C|nr:sporulation integral membrane protein YlbJ [Alkalihalobacillus sp. BA299]
MNSSIFKTITLAILATSLTASLMIYPKESFEASLRGLTMWWEVVFPSLLPFFIVSELLIGFGVVTFIGTLLNPLMRPVFRVPGVGGFVWAMGLASGFPAGAKLTARLRQEKQLTRLEAERLVTFTNASNPLFIFGAVAVGFFHNPALGVVLALAHYLGNFFVGFIMRFHGNKEETPLKVEGKQNSKSFKHALKSLHEERLKDGRPIGKLLGDAVQSSINTLLMIGGFIILFSVLNKLLSLIGIVTVLSSFMSIILTFLSLPSELSLPLISGIFEITLGSQMTSEIENALLLQQVIIVSFILAFSGFSVQAQVASILAETDIRFKPYFIARILHGIFASSIVIVLWNPLFVNQMGASKDGTIPVFLQEQTWSWLLIGWKSLAQFGSLITLSALIIYIAICSKRARTIKR